MLKHSHAVRVFLKEEYLESFATDSCNSLAREVAFTEAIKLNVANEVQRKRTSSNYLVSDLIGRISFR